MVWQFFMYIFNIYPLLMHDNAWKKTHEKYTRYNTFSYSIVANTLLVKYSMCNKDKLNNFK